MRFLFILFLGNTCLAQGLSGDLEKIVAKLNTEDEVYIKATATVRTSAAGSILYTAKSKMLRSASLGSATILDGHESYRNSKHEVLVNPDDKTVFVREVVHYNERDFSEKLLKDVRKYLEEENKDREQVKYTEKLLSDQNGIRVYSIKNAPGLKEMRMELDMNRLVVKKAEFWFSGDGDQPGYYCIVNYDQFEYTLGNERTLLAESNYFQKDGSGKFRLAGRLQTYKLITE